MLKDLFTKPVTVDFSDPDLSSNGGALLLKALDESLGLTRRLSECISDERDPSRTQHDVLSLIRQRVFGLCCGYEDANDVSRYKHDAIQKMLCDEEPSQGGDLASQPTISRFENQISEVDLYRVSCEIFKLVANRHRKRLGKRAKTVTIDLDATVNFAHGAQQLSLFNGFYDGRCFLPLMAFLSFNDESEQYLVGTVLRSGIPGNAGVLGTLRRLIRQTRKIFPKARINVRLDGGFSGPDVLDLLDLEKVGYLVGYAGNNVLSLYSAHALHRARLAFRRTKETVPFYGSTRSYSAGSWRKRRRVLFKAEVVQHDDREPRDNVRYVVTNLDGTAESLYREYLMRCDSENRIKEAKIGLSIDRVSCSRFSANQFRVLLGTAAFILFQELRLRAKRTPAARWQVDRLRQCLIQVAARVTSSVRRLLVRLPRHHPWADLWLQLAQACTR
jgi:hypothetical protein